MATKTICDICGVELTPQVDKYSVFIGGQIGTYDTAVQRSSELNYEDVCAVCKTRVAETIQYMAKERTSYAIQDRSTSGNQEQEQQARSEEHSSQAQD